MGIMRTKRNTIRVSGGDRVYLTIIYLFLTLFIAAVIYPLIYVVSCSFSHPEALIKGRVFLWPVDPGFQGYEAVFRNQRIWAGYRNTALYTVVGTLIGMAATIIGAYVMSRREFPIRKLFMTFFIITMFFNGGTIPTFMLIRNLGFLDKIWAIVLPGAFSVWLAIIGRTFIQSTIPEELYEATSLDGGDYVQHFTKVVLPLSKPILAVLALNFALGHWNSYFSALLYLNTASKFPLQIILRSILIQNTMTIDELTSGVDVVSAQYRQYLAELLKYSLIIVASVPLLVVYPFIQKYFIKGVMIGSLKG